MRVMRRDNEDLKGDGTRKIYCVFYDLVPYLSVTEMNLYVMMAEHMLRQK